MQRRRLQISVLIISLLAPAATYAQSSTDQEQLRYQRAIQEIEGVIVDTRKLDDPFALVTVKSKAASLMWRYDRNRAQTLFVDLWKYVDQQRSDSFNQDEARTVLLKYLFPLNSGLAAKLMKELSNRQGDEASLRAQATGNDPDVRRLANVSAGLVEQDATIAARLLEQSLSVGITPTALSVLSRMREKNPILANYVVSQTLAHIGSRPSIIALTGLHLLTAYVFPPEPYSADSNEARSSDDALRFQYFSTAYEVLRTSLQESESLLTKEKRYTENDLRFRAIYQAQMALILAALAPRYAPQLTEELSVLARRLSGVVPATIANLSRFVVARLRGDQTNTENPETNIAIAIANGDFDEARRLIDKLEDEAGRKSFLQTLAKAEFKVRLNEADLSEALNVARRIENANLRVLLLVQLARAAYRKDDLTLSRLIISEARAALTSDEKDGLRARVLLSFASETVGISDSDAIDLLHNAVSVINSLSKPDSGTQGLDRQPTNMAAFEINDPRSLVDSPDLQRAFSSLARADFEGTLIAAGRINPLPVQLIARLATSEAALTNRTKKPNAAPEKKSRQPAKAGGSVRPGVERSGTTGRGIKKLV